MRTKALLLFLTCVSLTSIFLFVLPGRPHHSLNNIVKETQDKISNIRDNIISAGDQLGESPPSLQADPRYLEQLGLYHPTAAAAAGDSSSSSSPSHLLINGAGGGGGGGGGSLTVVTAVEPGRAELVPGFVRSVGHYLNTDTTNIVIFDLGLARYERELVGQVCNSTQCTVAEFQFHIWPNHVANLKLQAYRPIALQLILKESDLVLWLDIEYRLTVSDLSPWIEAAKATGIQAWPQEPLTKELANLGGVGSVTATTSLTHPKMFEYFPDTKKEDFEFQHMVSGSCLLLSSPSSSSPSSLSPLTTSLILPWLQCVLIEDCINPIGAQSTGCRFDKKPQYRYSGCHKYDVSALNIVLGRMFQFGEVSYLSQVALVRRVEEDAVTLVTGTADTNRLSSSSSSLLTASGSSNKNIENVFTEDLRT